MNLLTIPQAAKRLSLTRQRVHKLVTQGRIKAQKIGVTYVISERDLERFKAIPRKSGAPQRALEAA